MSRVLLLAGVLLLLHCIPAAAADPAAIGGRWAVKATVIDASGGARPRVGAVRLAVYSASSCAAPCLVRLSETLPGGGHPRIAFSRTRRLYSGSARTRLRCAGGSRVRARVSDSFRISRAVRRGARKLAADLAGDAFLRGRCGGRRAELHVRWTARRSDLPEPPTPSFTSGPDPLSLSADGGVATFTDASADDVDGGTIVARSWDFGDPASGAANSASGVAVSHRYTTVGTFTVRLTVTDDDGLSATIDDVIVVDP
jgi:hypothetical protein